MENMRRDMNVSDECMTGYYPHRSYLPIYALCTSPVAEIGMLFDLEVPSRRVLVQESVMSRVHQSSTSALRLYGPASGTGHATSFSTAISQYTVEENQEKANLLWHLSTAISMPSFGVPPPKQDIDLGRQEGPETA